MKIVATVVAIVFCLCDGFSEIREHIRHYWDELVTGFRPQQGPEDVDSD